MLKRLCLALLTGAVALALTVPAGAADEKKLRVVIIDGQNNHKWKQTTPVLKKTLEDSGRFTVDVASQTSGEASPTRTIDFPPDLSKYDVVLSNYNGAPWPEEFQKDLEARLKDAKIALVIVHAANNSFTGKWPEYDKMIALGWRDNAYGNRVVVDDSGKEVRVEKGKGPGANHGPQHAFKVTIRDGEHPVTKGMPKEWLHEKDELYHGLRGPGEHMHVLATAFSAKDKGGTGEHEPMIWTVDYGKGRVFHTPMGHDLDGLRCVGFAATLQRGTEWAATGKVTIPLPSNFPTADKTSSLPK